MKKMLAVSLIVVVALFLGACSAPEPTEFTSDAGAFSVMTPATLEEQTQSVPTAAGDIETHMFTGEVGGTAYMVAYSDYPEQVLAQVDAQTLLEGARDGAIQNSSANLVSEEAITLGEYPGIEVVADVKSDKGEEGTLKSHIYLVGNRLYQVMVMGSKGSLDMTKVDAFLDSFKLVGQ